MPALRYMLVKVPLAGAADQTKVDKPIELADTIINIAATKLST